MYLLKGTENTMKQNNRSTNEEERTTEQCKLKTEIHRVKQGN